MKNHPKHCIDCDEGTYELLTVDFTEKDPNGAEVTVPGIEVLRCSNCGEELIPAASSKKISKAVAEANEQLKPEQLYDMFSRFDVDQQKELADICGFGEKTFGRWLKGTQTVSRSMGYYLRVLDHFPEAFEYVKNRDWRTTSAPSRLTTATADQQGDSEPSLDAFEALLRRQFTPDGLQQNPTQIFELAGQHY